MLTRINLKNFILINQASLDLVGNFCVITGESGSGKSMIFEAIKFCLGFAKNKDYVGAAADEAFVVLEFNITDNIEAQQILAESSIQHDNDLIIRRVCYPGQKTKCFLNDVAVNINLVKKLAGSLLEIHSQNDKGFDDNELSLISIIDNYGQIKSIQELESLYKSYYAINQTIESLKQDSHKTNMEKAFYEFAVTEIDALNLKDDEEVELENTKKLLSNLKAINENLLGIKANLSDKDNAIGSSWAAYNKSLKLFDLTNKNKFKELAAILEKTSIELEECVNVVDRELHEVTQEQDIEEIDDRLYRIKNIARKYLVPSNELTKISENFKAKLAIVEQFDEKIAALNKEKQKFWNQYLDLALTISTERKQIAKKLSNLINDELQNLKMEGSMLEFHFERLADENITKLGIDKIQILIRTNHNQDLLNIKDVASGGEKSRILLVIKSITNASSKKALIFDEIDTGIGGATASAVGKKIKSLSCNQQILLITHNAQVAAVSDQLFMVTKQSNQGSTKIIIENLTLEKRKIEIARMISGEFVTNEALAQADKLIVN